MNHEREERTTKRGGGQVMFEKVIRDNLSPEGGRGGDRLPADRHFTCCEMLEAMKRLDLGKYL